MAQSVIAAAKTVDAQASDEVLMTTCDGLEQVLTTLVHLEKSQSCYEKGEWSLNP